MHGDVRRYGEVCGEIAHLGESEVDARDIIESGEMGLWDRKVKGTQDVIELLPRSHLPN